MNEVLKVLKERRSIRAFRPEPLKKEDLDAIVEAGLYAPSAKNLQSTKLVVVRDAAVLARLERLNSRILGTPEGDTLLWCAGGHCGAVRQRVSQLASGRLSGNGQPDERCCRIGRRLLLDQPGHGDL